MENTRLTFELFTQDVVVLFLLSFLTFCIAMLLTPVYTYFAFKYKLWKRPRTHSVTGDQLKVISKLRIKRTIPRMAGLIIIAATFLVTILFNLDRQQTWLPLAALVGAGGIGLIDDFINVKGLGGGVAGLRAPVKFTLMATVGAIGAWWFYYKLGFDTVHIPFVGGELVLGWLIMPVFVLAVISTSNAVNITDGVDGLAGGLLISAFGALGVIAILQGHLGIAGFCLTLVGALLAYTWFNIAPARFVMGDTGSFALGTALGVVAMQTDTLLLLPVIGLVFVAEAGSTLIQILSKKIRHRKIFMAAPLHHHLEAAREWPKTKVTMRFWVIGQVCATIGVILALAGGHIT
jgi:phospho-N-acetylmuramoyl-pentapeptide-transferase